MFGYYKQILFGPKGNRFFQARPILLHKIFISLCTIQDLVTIIYVDFDMVYLYKMQEEIKAIGEFTQDDLRFVADRLYPVECSQLLSYLPGSRGALRTKNNSKKNRPSLQDDWVTENSRAECLESLIECNRTGKKGGCTKNWLESALHKLGRADLASRLKKRWKKKMKNHNKIKTMKIGGSDEKSLRNQQYRRKATVTLVQGHCRSRLELNH